MPSSSQTGRPMRIQVEDGMGVLVIDEFMSSLTPGIEPNHDVLLFPAVMKFANRLSSLDLPQCRFQHLFGGFVAGCENQQWGTRFQPKGWELGGEDVSHLLKLVSYAACIFGTPIRKHAKVRTANFDPGFLAGGG